MTDIPEKAKIDVGAVRERISQIMRGRNLTQATIAKKSGINSGVLSRFIAERYEGDNQAVASKLLIWAESLAQQDTMPAPLTRDHDFVKTTASERILLGLRFAQVAGDLVTVYGEPGVGKTISLENYQRTASNVWLATMSPDTSSKVPMLEELGLSLGLTLSGGAASMRRKIVARVRDTGGLILIDEAQHLDAKALDELRSIYDKTRIGMVLCGNPQLKARAETLQQINSRVGKNVKIGRPSRPDVALLMAPFQIEGRDETDFLHSIAQLPGGLRCVVKVIRLALMIANGENDSFKMKYLVAAWEDLSLTEPV
ncbi:AAA family ATPase [Acetobacter senegalensis]|uniref:AAA family ATPase n=1 Tax=Acetobacter senegalensis TaxID=446692 RepID=UPI002656E444|nr:AAA family ATPase [Acetobacter senegalensis]MDN7351348.1 AAA family ATPase [Acetobacter senegalensis]